LCLLLATRRVFLAYSSTLKMEATFFPEASVNFLHTTRRYISEDRNIHSLCLRGSHVSRVAECWAPTYRPVRSAYLTSVFLTSHDSRPLGCVILTLRDGQWLFYFRAVLPFDVEFWIQREMLPAYSELRYD
jgi:hypothetical protein